MVLGLASPRRLLDAPRAAVRGATAVGGGVVGLVGVAAAAAPALQTPASPQRLASTAVGVTGRAVRGATSLTVNAMVQGTELTAHMGVAAAGVTARTVADTTAYAARGTARLAGAPLEAAAGRVRRDVGREVSAATRALVDLHPARLRRRVWTTHDRAHIEVRGLPGTGPAHQRMAADVRRRLNRLAGVRWAEVNAVTGQVLVAFDERRVDVGTLLGTVRRVEQAQGTRDEEFPWSRPVHPADTTPVAAAAVEFTADCVAMLAAIVGRTGRLPTVPRGVRAAVALLEVEKPLRRKLKRRVGPIGTDVVIAVASAAVAGLSQNPAGPAIDALYRFELLVEALSRQAAWRRRETDLCALPDLVPKEVSERPPRPRPRPKGPIEIWVDELGMASLASAATVFALTRRPGRAAEAILVAVPKAAKVGRDCFAATVATRLAGSGVLPLNGVAFRRLDRVSAVVLDSPTLCTRDLQVLSAEAAPGEDDAAVWRAAVPLVRGRTIDELDGERGIRSVGFALTPDRSRAAAPPGAVRLVVRRGRRRLGVVTVGRELDPHADAVVDAAGAGGARVLLTEDASVTDLLPRADEVVPVTEPLAHAVRRLQAEGHLVLVVSGDEDAALAEADVGVAVLGRGRDGAPVCWSADLLCGPALGDVWRVLRARAAARGVSERGVRLARAGSALGTLLAVVGGRGRNSHALVPVHTAALIALLAGTATALRATSGALPPAVRHVPWHALDPVDVLAAADDTRKAIPSQRTASSPRQSLAHQAVAAVHAVGASHAVRRVLRPSERAAALARATVEELRDPLTPVLTVGAAASAIVGSGVDALLVMGVMSGNAVVSGVQRLRAESALRSLLMEQVPAARRIPRSRGDAVQPLEDLGGVPHETVPAHALEVGDIIAVRASDVVPADARLLFSTDLEVDESTLTGESVPVAKDVRATPAAPLAERHCMLFQGTTVVAGSAHAVVVATGDVTEAGRAVRAGGRATGPAGIQARLAEVTRTALPMTAIGGGAVTGLGLLRGLPLRDAVAAGVSIAVAAVPEGLPLVATVAQASAARRLSRRGVLVRSSRTLEAFGRVDTVCFDKTGTLTEGRLAVTRLAAANADLDDADPRAGRLIVIAARACPSGEGHGIARLPHATDRAVLEAAVQANESLDGWRPIREMPFETNRGYAASLGRDDDGPTLAVKGAPETVLPLCRNGRDRGQRTAERLASEGLRVIAVAERRAVDEQVDDVEALVEDLTLLGFVGIADRPRDVAPDAVRRLGEDGARVVMVTGDHPLTARAIARSVGVAEDAVLTGAQLERMTEEERVRQVARTSVFARVSPEQKVQIVQALRADGRVVAMVGDGTNDAAAIRTADVGIGVAASGSTSASSAADVVLTDADITLIHDALLEGRALWRRVRDAVSILVGGNAGEVAFMVLGTALGGRPPMNVRQMLLVNVLTDMFPALAVAVADNRAASDDADGEESASAVSTLERGLPRAVAVRGTATTVGASAAWGVGRLTGLHRRASTMGLAALVCTQLGQTLVMGRRSRLVVLTSLASAAVLVAAVETPVVSHFLGCTPIGPVAWGVVLASSAGGTLVAVVAPRLLTATASAVAAA